MLDPRRSSVLGMTDIAILMGACPEKWGNARTIWMEKKGLYVKEETAKMSNGHLFEPAIMQKFIEHMREEHGLEITPAEVNTFTTHPTLPIGGTVDFIGTAPGGPIGSEFKSTAWLDEWGPAETNMVPYRVKIQTNGYMLLRDLPTWEVMALMFDRGAEFRHYTINRDEDLINKIKQVACAFWDTYIIGDEEPEDAPVAPPFSIPVVDTADASPEIKGLMAKAASLSERIEARLTDTADDEAAYKATLDEIKARFGTAKSYSSNGWVASWSRKIEPELNTEAAYRALRNVFLGKTGDTGYIQELERVNTIPKATQRFTFKKEKAKK